MKPSLQPGITHSFTFRVPRSKTVAALYPEASEFQAMPAVFATGFLVGFVEWVCIQAVNPHLDWPAEMTLGTHVDLSHSAPTPPGMEVTAHVRLTQVEGRKLVFDVDVRDDAEVIASGRHERFVIEAGKFTAKVARKAEQALAHQPAADPP
ncbi:MAG: thioesterase family protein [Betaproteobacteria bacterium]|nr:thioesterase family protein [Betaproteobacteria bacterium]